MVAVAVTRSGGGNWPALASSLEPMTKHHITKMADSRILFFIWAAQQGFVKAGAREQAWLGGGWCVSCEVAYSYDRYTPSLADSFTEIV